MRAPRIRDRERIKIRLYLALAVFLIWAVLFGRFWLGEYAYVYLDVGKDTFDINVPLYTFFSKLLHGEGDFPYSLSAGFGMDLSSYLYQYLNPLNLFCISLPNELLAWGILLSALAKLLIISQAALSLFDRWLSDTVSAGLASLCFTFCSWVLLWGQHYGFATSIMLFTVFLVLVHSMIDDNCRSLAPLAVLWVTLMLWTNYYFLYMSGIFAALYLVLWTGFRCREVKKLPRQLLALLGTGLLGCLIGGTCLVPTLSIFLGSTRQAGAVTDAAASGSFLFRPYHERWLFSFLGRFFSLDTFGVGNDYSGYLNYYEMAMLSVSSLSLPAFIYLLQEKRTRKGALGFAAAGLIALIFPLSGYLLTMNPYAQRWTYVLCLGQALGIGFFLRFLRRGKDQKKLLVSFLAGAVLFAAAAAFLYLNQERGRYSLNMRALIIYGLFYLLFALLILLTPRIFLTGTVGAILCAELVMSGWGPVNFRQNPTRQEMAGGYYNDATGEVLASIEEEGPFRIEKTYESVSLNDGLAQGYAGTSVYLTTNSASLVGLKKYLGLEGITDSKIKLPAVNQPAASLLGVRYMIALPHESLSETAWKKTESFPERTLYENALALPFGYLYEKVWDEETVREIPAGIRSAAALYGFESEMPLPVEFEKAERPSGERRSLLDEPFVCEDVKGKRKKNGIVLNKADPGAVPELRMDDLGRHFAPGALHSLHLEMKADGPFTVTLYFKSGRDETYSAEKAFTIEGGKETIWDGLLPDDVTGLRFDLNTPVKRLVIQELSLERNESDLAALADLAESPVSEITWEGGSYAARVENNGDKAKLLCVPLIASKGWKGSLDGKEQEVVTVNGGMTGLVIPPGHHFVRLDYEVPGRLAGRLLTGFGLILYILWLLIRRKKRRKTDMEAAAKENGGQRAPREELAWKE